MPENSNRTIVKSRSHDGQTTISLNLTLAAEYKLELFIPFQCGIQSISHVGWQKQCQQMKVTSKWLEDVKIAEKAVVQLMYKVIFYEKSNVFGADYPDDHRKSNKLLFYLQTHHFCVYLILRCQRKPCYFWKD